MIRCVNCGKNVSQGKRHYLEIEPEEVLQLIPQAHPISNLPDDSIVCHSCWSLPDSFGQKKNCACCGKYLHRMKGRTLTDDSELVTCIRDIVAKEILPKKLDKADQICCPCWQKCNKLAKKLYKPTKPVKPGCPSTSLSDQPKVNSEGELTVTSKVVMLHFERAPSTQDQCFIPGCHNTQTRKIPLSMKRRLFTKFNIYVPVDCHICHKHLEGNVSWELNKIETHHTFTEAHICDLMSLLKEERPINFNDIDSLDDNLVQYWFGMDKVQFHMLLEEVPQLSEMDMGSTALAAHILKLKHGDTIEQISSLFEMEHTELQMLMCEASQFLTPDFISKISVNNEVYSD